MPVVIASLSADDKTPGIYQQSLFGRGKNSISDTPRYVVFTGNILSGVTLTADSSLVPCYSESDAASMCGVGSELYLQAIEGLNSGAQVFLAPVAEASGASAATVTIAWTNLGTGKGQIGLFFGENYASFVVDVTNKSATADNCVAAINAVYGGFCSAVKAASDPYSVTVSVLSKGIRGNNWYIRKDMSLAPTGCQITISGGTPTASGLVPFSGGTGQDDATNVISLLKTAEFFRIGVAQNDAVNAQRFEDHVNAESDALISHLEQAVFGHNGALAAAQALAQTTLNAYQCQLLWHKYSMKHPSQIAARFAAIRAVRESTNPWERYDGLFNDPGSFLWGNVPQQTIDIPTHSELRAALNAGVTPVTTKGGDSVVVRSIVTKCLNGTVPDYRCLDTCDVSVTHRVREELGAVSAEFAEANKGVGPDLPDGLQQPAGVGTPSLFKAEVIQLGKRLQKYLWIQDFEANTPEPQYNSDKKRIETVWTVIVRKQQHQILNSIEQAAA